MVSGKFLLKSRKSLYNRRFWVPGLKLGLYQEITGLDPALVGLEAYIIWRASLRKIIQSYQVKMQYRVPWITWQASQYLCLGAHMPFLT